MDTNIDVTEQILKIASECETTVGNAVYVIDDLDTDECGIPCIVLRRPFLGELKEHHGSISKSEAQVVHYNDVLARQITLYPAKGAAYESLMKAFPGIMQRICKNGIHAAEGRVLDDAKKFKAGRLFNKTSSRN